MSVHSKRRVLASALDDHHEIAAKHLSSLEGETDGELDPRFPLDKVKPSPLNPRRQELDEAGVNAEFIQTHMIKPGETVDAWQDRLEQHLENFDKESDPQSYKVLVGLFELALSVKNDGLYQPIIITPQHEIVMGECRWVASLLGDIQYNAVIIKKFALDAVDKARLLENTKRSNLSTASVIKAVRRIMEGEIKAPCGPRNSALKEELVRKVFGVKHTTAARYLAFCKLQDGDPVLREIYAGKLPTIRSAYEAATERLRVLKNPNQASDPEPLNGTPPPETPRKSGQNVGTRPSNKYPPVKTRLPGNVGGETLFKVLAEHADITESMATAFREAGEKWPRANDVQRKEIFTKTLNAFFAMSDPEGDDNDKQAELS